MDRAKEIINQSGWPKMSINIHKYSLAAEGLDHVKSGLITYTMSRHITSLTNSFRKLSGHYPDAHRRLVSTTYYHRLLLRRNESKTNQNFCP